MVLIRIINSFISRISDDFFSEGQSVETHDASSINIDINEESVDIYKIPYGDIVVDPEIIVEAIINHWNNEKRDDYNENHGFWQRFHFS